MIKKKYINKHIKIRDKELYNRNKIKYKVELVKLVEYNLILINKVWINNIISKIVLIISKIKHIVKNFHLMIWKKLAI